jgi:hypothetical protein
MYLREAPADTLSYMILGYSVILGTITLLLMSLVLRFRSLARDLKVLEELESK